MHFTLSLNCVQVETLPIAQDTPVLTDSVSRCYNPYTHACNARPLSTDGWTSGFRCPGSGTKEGCRWTNLRDLFFVKEVVLAQEDLEVFYRLLLSSGPDTSLDPAAACERLATNFQ